MISADFFKYGVRCISAVSLKLLILILGMGDEGSQFATNGLILGYSQHGLLSMVTTRVFKSIERTMMGTMSL